MANNYNMHAIKYKTNVYSSFDLTKFGKTCG